MQKGSGGLARISELCATHGTPVYELAGETEPDGNAFMLLATWRRTALEWGWPEDAVAEVCREATSGDYPHLRRCLTSASRSGGTVGSVRIPRRRGARVAAAPARKENPK